MTVYDPPISERSPTIEVGALLDDPHFELDGQLVAGEGGLHRRIGNRRIQKSGLVLAGHLQGVVANRIQVLGETELSYFKTLGAGARKESAGHLFSLGVCCVVVTRGIEIPDEIRDEANRTGTPLVACTERSSLAIARLHTLLDERLAPRARLHGVLVDVFEVGVLLLGDSGVGKSEAALELVMHGHRIVADDVVEVDYRPPGMVFGEPNDTLRHFMEVRGLGILDIKELFGVTAIRERKRIDLVARLDLWEEGEPGGYDRLGVDEHTMNILGVPIREVRLPVRPGRNMSSIVEIAARHELLRQAGTDTAKGFVDRVDQTLAATVHDGSSMRPERVLRPRDRAPRGHDSESAVPPPAKGPGPS